MTRTYQLIWGALLLGQTIALAQEPPAQLFFGDTSIQNRVRLNPPLTTISGNYRLQLVELDHVTIGSQAGLRLLVRATAIGGTLPDELNLIGPTWAIDAEGRRLTGSAYLSVADGEARWLAINLTGQAGGLAMFTATIGPRPSEEQRAVPVDLARLGEVWRLPAVDKAVGLVLMRRETAQLPILDAPPPLYRGIDSTIGLDSKVDENGPFLSLRLYSLDPDDDQAGWRLTNLRLQTAAGPVADWRYSRRLWRPDWGGWLGAKGRDWQAEEAISGGPSRGVLIEQVVANGPAEQAGLRAGDLVVAVDGRPTVDAFSLGELIRVTKPETTCACEVWRDGRRRAMQITVGHSPLWPELDALEFSQGWSRLQALYPDGSGSGRVLSLWDWQTAQPLAGTDEPSGLDLIFTRPGPARGTTFVFSDVPTGDER